MNIRERIVESFGLKKNIIVLLIMVILVGMGERMAERFLPIYLLALGGGILSVGFLNGMSNLLGALYSFPGGYLSDLLGYKKIISSFQSYCYGRVPDCNYFPILAGSIDWSSFLFSMVSCFTARFNEYGLKSPSSQ